MKALLDTHVWLWWGSAPERLKSKARALIGDRANELYLSSASVWEIMIKAKLGKLELPEPAAVFITSRVARDSLLSLDITQTHAIRAGDLPPYHRDPFDRMIIAQAMIEDIPILTADRRFKQYDVKILQA
jgi:PIN domain nuclease of toxin-antitoxin system